MLECLKNIVKNNHKLKGLTTLVSLVFCFSFLYSAAQPIPGLSQGGLMDDEGIVACSDGNGGLVIAGTSRSYGKGSNDIYLIKVNENLIVEWTQTYGTTHQEYVYSIYPVSDGYLISGKSFDPRNGSPGVYLLKVDKNGTIILEGTYGYESRDMGFSIIETSTNDIVILAYTRNLDPYGTVRIIKLNQSGVIIWDNTYGFERDEYAFQIIEDSFGNYMFAGTKDGFFRDIHKNFKNHDADFWIAKIDPDGNEIYSNFYGSTGHDFGSDILEVADGYLFLGSTQSSGEGSFDMALLHYSYDGDSNWLETYGGEEFEYGLSMTNSSDGELFLCGTSASYSENLSTDIMLVKTNIEGELLWEMSIGGSQDDWGNDVISTTDGGCIVIGTTESFGSGRKDVFFTKVSKEGEVETFSIDIEKNINKQMISPNPARNYATINIPNNTNDVFRLHIYTLNGIEVKSSQISKSSRNISTSSLKSGTYVYTLTNIKNDTIISGKLIIY